MTDEIQTLAQMNFVLFWRQNDFDPSQKEIIKQVYLTAFLSGALEQNKLDLLLFEGIGK